MHVDVRMNPDGFGGDGEALRHIGVVIVEERHPFAGCRPDAGVARRTETAVLLADGADPVTIGS